MKKNKTGSGRYWLKPEEDFSRSGVVLAAERDQSKLSSRIVSNGLCHESFFRRLEQGLVGCEKVLADALLERMGVSPSRMLFYLNLWEEEYLLTRDIGYGQFMRKIGWKRNTVRGSIRSRHSVSMICIGSFPC